MKIVVDLGCETHGYEESLFTLIERFKPDVVFAFDPLSENIDLSLHGVDVRKRRAAAWVHDGEVEFGVSANGGQHATLLREKDERGEWERTETVPCFDFSRWLTQFTEPVVVKMDVEGAEFEILEKMVADGTDRLIERLLVEWHDFLLPEDYRERRRVLEDRLSCQMEGWW